MAKQHIIKLTNEYPPAVAFGVSDLQTSEHVIKEMCKAGYPADHVCYAPRIVKLQQQVGIRVFCGAAGELLYTRPISRGGNFETYFASILMKHGGMKRHREVCA